MSHVTIAEQTPPIASATERQSNRWQSFVHKVVPGILGAALYVLNNLNVLHAIIAPPPGYLPYGVQRHMDVGEYLCWLEALKTSWAIPNYHAPWITSPDFIMPAFMPLALLERLIPLSPVVALQLLSFVSYIFLAYVVAYACRSFCQTRAQALWSVLLAFCCVPLVCLPGVSHLFKLAVQEPWIKFLVVGDGFLHGLVTWPLVTLGTAFQVLSMSLLVRYANTPDRRRLGLLASLSFISALMHPFEIAVTLTVVAIVFVRQFGLGSKTFARLGLIAGAAGIGLSFHVFETLRVPWIHELSEANFLQIMPDMLFGIIGVPAIVVVALLLIGYPRRSNTESTVLKAWFLSSLVVFYLPGMPFGPHFLDGIFFAIGFLVVLQARELMEDKPAFLAPLIRACAVVLILGSVTVHVMLRREMWQGGIVPQEKAGHLSAIAPKEEFATVQWLRQHASPDDMVLATRETAPWLATVPMHSFASHWLSSLLGTRPGFDAARAAFFTGTLPSNQAHQFLNTIGVRFVVVADGSPASGYMDNAQQAARIGSWTIYEIPGAHMKPYHDARILALGGSAL